MNNRKLYYEKLSGTEKFITFERCHQLQNGNSAYQQDVKYDLSSKFASNVQGIVIKINLLDPF